jgi:hypothetical protein
MTERPRHASEVVALVGTALFGDEWSGQLAQLLDLNPRTARRIAAAAREGRDYPSARALIGDLGPLMDTLEIELAQRAELVRRAKRELARWAPQS